MDKFNTTQIGLAKFNNKTLKENRNWKTKKNWTGASYGFQHYIPEKIPYNSYLYIIEMNNETNKIAGVGFIRNQRRSEWRSKFIMIVKIITDLLLKVNIIEIENF